VSGDPLSQVPLEELRQRTSAKWQVHPPDVLPLWVAEMDVPLAEPIQRVLVDAVRRGDTGYAMGDGYAEALAAFAERRWGFAGIDPARSGIVPDVMLGIVEVLEVLTSPGDAIVVNCPVYPPFYAFVRNAGRRVVEAPLTAAHRVDLDALATAFASATAGGGRAVHLLCSPHNPTGTVHTADELTAIAALADAFGVRVVADEIHAPLVLPGATFTPFLSVPGSERAFTLISASKAWNLAGLKAALVLAGPDAADDLARIPEVVSHGPSHLGVLAHTAALSSCDAWLDDVVAGLDRNRWRLAELLADALPEIGYRPPEGTFLAWLDCRALHLHAAEAPEPGLVTLSAGPAAVFLDRGRVALSAGEAFGTGGVGHVRLNLATSPSILEEAVARMAAAVRDEGTAHPR
jgi:cysteine-S-conjugate beta-lyase